MRKNICSRSGVNKRRLQTTLLPPNCRKGQTLCLTFTISNINDLAPCLFLIATGVLQASRPKNPLLPQKRVLIKIKPEKQKHALCLHKSIVCLYLISLPQVVILLVNVISSESFCWLVLLYLLIWYYHCSIQRIKCFVSNLLFYPACCLRVLQVGYLHKKGFTVSSKSCDRGHAV